MNYRDTDQTKFGEQLQWSLSRLAHSITPMDAISGEDATGGKVGSLTEAVMGVTAALVQIAEAIEGLANATLESKK